MLFIVDNRDASKVAFRTGMSVSILMDTLLMTLYITQVGWGVMGQRGEMGLLFKLFIKKY